jgi:hypothetical protein
MGGIDFLGAAVECNDESALGASGTDGFGEIGSAFELKPDTESPVSEVRV